MDGGKDEWKERWMEKERDGEMIRWKERWMEGGVREWIKGRMDGCQRRSRHF